MKNTSDFRILELTLKFQIEKGNQNYLNIRIPKWANFWVEGSGVVSTSFM